MRIERHDRPLWLAGAAAGLALCLLLGALAGWGRALPPLPDGAATPPLPVLLPVTTRQAGALAPDSDALQRPLFHPDRRPQPFRVQEGGAEGNASGLRLTGVVITPAAALATLSGADGLSVRLRLGGPAVQGWQLLELSPRQATLSGPQGVQTLELAVYEDRTGPAPATPSAAPGPDLGLSPAMARAAAAAVPPAATPAPPAPDADGAVATEAAQLQAIRERIQARRRQMQQQQNARPNVDRN